MNDTVTPPSSDHDLLVTLVAKLDAFIAGQTAVQNDHEARIRALEKNELSQQGGTAAKKEYTDNAKWVIGTLLFVLSLCLTAIGLLLFK